MSGRDFCVVLIIVTVVKRGQRRAMARDRRHLSPYTQLNMKNSALFVRTAASKAANCSLLNFKSSPLYPIIGLP